MDQSLDSSVVRNCRKDVHQSFTHIFLGSTLSSVFNKVEYLAVRFMKAKDDDFLFPRTPCGYCLPGLRFLDSFSFPPPFAPHLDFHVDWHKKHHTY
jgi:hypothetical protein